MFSNKQPILVGNGIEVCLNQDSTANMLMIWVDEPTNRSSQIIEMKKTTILEDDFPEAENGFPRDVKFQISQQANVHLPVVFSIRRNYKHIIGNGSKQYLFSFLYFVSSYSHIFLRTSSNELPRHLATW